MSTGRKGSSLRPDIARIKERLDEAERGAVEVGPSGDVWQHSRGLWYRAYDSNTPLSSWELAQRLGADK